jgi:2-methylcitrate dehydratase PrpD
MVLSRPDDVDERAASGRGFLALAHWAGEARLDALPDDVMRRAALVLADDIAAIVASAAEPEVEAGQSLLARSAGSAAESTILGISARRVDRYTAAAANGLAACWAELDEGYRVVPCHAGAYIIPALIAEAEASGAAIRDVIASLAVAYEVTARIAHAFPVDRLRVHPHGAFAPLGAAAGVGRLRGLAPQAYAAALSSAMSMSHAGPYNHAPQGALARNAWTATGAWCGMRAADLAVLGIGGLNHSCYDVMVTCYGHEAHPERLTDSLGERFAITSGYHKLIACCQYAHSAVEALLALRARDVAIADPDAISTISVETHPMGATLADAAPETVLGGKFSMLHAIATTAVHGSAGAEAFARGSLADPRVASLRRRIRLTLHPDIRPWPKDRPARVHVDLTDGRRLTSEVESGRGGPDSPFSPAEIEAKVTGLTRGLYPALAPWLIEVIRAPASASGTWTAALRAATGQRV